MLVIVMHNNDDYLRSITDLARSMGIKSMKTVEQKSLGTKMVGLNASVTVVKGQAMDKYSKAFIASLEGKGKADEFLSAVENDAALNMHADDSAFICMLPFGSIKDVCV